VQAGEGRMHELAPGGFEGASVGSVRDGSAGGRGLEGQKGKELRAGGQLSGDGVEWLAAQAQARKCAGWPWRQRATLCQVR